MLGFWLRAHIEKEEEYKVYKICHRAKDDQNILAQYEKFGWRNGMKIGKKSKATLDQFDLRWRYEGRACLTFPSNAPKV
jgi:hypothetical protein